VARVFLPSCDLEEQAVGVIVGEEQQEDSGWICRGGGVGVKVVVGVVLLVQGRAGGAGLLQQDSSSLCSTRRAHSRDSYWVSCN
jgi:hypothetical protein